MFRFLLPLVVATNPAWAECPAGEQTFMSCEIESNGKSLAVCFDDLNAYYRYGIAGQVPELALTSSIADLDYRPWNGSGRDIWEEISFYNGPYTYAVHGGYQRPWGDERYEDVPERNFGAVSVALADDVIADLECDRSTIEFTWVDDIILAKKELGYDWDDRALRWVALPD